MKILEWYDSVAISFLCTLSRIGAGFGGFPLPENIVKEDFEPWEMWLARGAFACLCIPVSLLFLQVVTQVL
jgi:hypothetical protein